MTQIFENNDVIREYFSSPRVRWGSLFESNNISDEIIIEFKDRILKGNCISRCQAIVNMHVRNNRKMSKEVFELITTKVNIFDFYQLEKVYDLLEVVRQFSKAELYMSQYGIHCLIERTPNVELEFVESMYELLLDNNTKEFYAVGALRSKTDILPEVREFLLKTLKENYDYSRAYATMLGRGDIFDEVFTPKELLEGLPSKYVVRFFETGCGAFGYQGFPSILDSIYNTPEIVEVLVHKMKEYADDDMNPRLRTGWWRNIQLLIIDHNDFNEISNKVADTVSDLKRNKLVWQEVAENILNNKLTDDELDAVLSRTDAPLWFTDKFQSKMIQLMFIRSNMNESILNDACSQGFF